MLDEVIRKADSVPDDTRVIVLVAQGDAISAANRGYGDTEVQSNAQTLLTDLLSAVSRVSLPWGEMKMVHRDPETGEEREL